MLRGARSKREGEGCAGFGTLGSAWGSGTAGTSDEGLSDSTGLTREGVLEADEGTGEEPPINAASSSFFGVAGGFLRPIGSVKRRMRPKPLA